MNFNIIVNKYLLMWHLLFTSSITNEVHEIKQRLWNEKKNKYIELQKEKEDILKYLDNYIPDDDDIFDEIEKSSIYKKIKQETNRYRLMLLEIWDKNKNIYLRELNKILKYNFKGEYNLLVLHPALEIVDMNLDINNSITIGKKFSMKEKDDFLTYIIYKIVKNDFLNIEVDQVDKAIVDTIVELIATNELYTRLTKESKYNLGKKSLRTVKEYIYPYWLMYLGVKKEDLEKYMVRDNILFNVNAYEYKENLKNVDILSFIKFIIRNKRAIFSVPNKNIGEMIEQL